MYISSTPWGNDMDRILSIRTGCSLRVVDQAEKAHNATTDVSAFLGLFYARRNFTQFGL
jgi:hypothetical protein